jgi:hypothetical protein
MIGCCQHSAADILPAGLSLVTLAGLLSASLLVSLVRRRASAHRSRVAVLARLATLKPGARPVEHRASTLKRG